MAIRKMPSVHTTGGEWVGTFYDETSAREWIASRMNPEMFTLDPERKPEAPAVGGVFIPADAKKAVKKLADANGFIANPKVSLDKRKAGAPPSPAALDDDAALTLAVAASLEDDSSDDNEREYEELSL